MAGSATTYAGDYGNDFFFGTPTAAGFNNANILKPEDAWNMDTKIDDGKPGTGKFITLEQNGFGSGAVACTTSANSTDYAGSYNLTNTSIACVPFIIKQY